ncbi:unnamed protein product [Echinostoma caproni]|uniref:DUF424 family protein n=1 Tax=Echinostoma caproni TaxID=27848 RepID=A0A183ALW1_9TREM|nr:unnamed protein product [Echinostoma caproni]
MAFSVNLRAEDVDDMDRKRLERIEDLNALGIGMIVTGLQQSGIVEEFNIQCRTDKMCVLYVTKHPMLQQK